MTSCPTSAKVHGQGVQSLRCASGSRRRVVIARIIRSFRLLLRGGQLRLDCLHHGQHYNRRVRPAGADCGVQRLLHDFSLLLGERDATHWKAQLAVAVRSVHPETPALPELPQELRRTPPLIRAPPP